MTTVWRWCERFSAGLSLETEELALLRPGVRQIAHPPQPSRGQIDRLAALEDRLDDVWSEEGERDHPTDVGPIDTMALGQFGNRAPRVVPISSRCPDNAASITAEVQLPIRYRALSLRSTAPAITAAAGGLGLA